MVVIRNTSLIACTPEQAFDYLSDLRNELDWNPKIESAEKLTDGPVARGTRFRAKWKSSPSLEVEVVEFERPDRWVCHNGGPIEVRFEGRLEPESGGTRLRTAFSPRPHGWFRLVFPIFLLVIRREERANMEHLRLALERHVAQA